MQARSHKPLVLADATLPAQADVRLAFAKLLSSRLVRAPLPLCLLAIVRGAPCAKGGGNKDDSALGDRTAKLKPTDSLLPKSAVLCLGSQWYPQCQSPSAGNCGDSRACL